MDNKLPKNFCILPWTALEVQPNGTVKPCCMYKDTLKKENGQEYKIQKDQFNDIWNSDELATIRKRFLSGTQPRGCHRCWMEELSGKNSKRIRDSRKYKHLITEEIIFGKPAPRYLDLKLGNICNLKCRICSPQYSSKWISEQRKYDIIDKNIKYYERLDWAEKSEIFWNNIESLIPILEHLDFTGGEPFMIKEHFDLLHKIIKQGYAHKITLHYNTNGTQLPLDALDNIFPHFKSVDVHFSVDGIGKHFEYQRHPAKWDQLLKNLNMWKTYESNKLDLSICHTVNVFNVLYLPEFIEWTENFDIKIYLNTLHEPLHYNISALPSFLKDVVKDKLLDYIERDFDQIIQFMENSDNSYQLKEFKRQIYRMDLVRVESFDKTFPELSELMNIIKIK
jgi:radical SAM protein with 4Fe4S-binding SPASM domain